MKRINKKTRSAVIAIACLVLTVTAASTSSIAETDPLVTLSYLNQTVIPKIKQEVTTSVLAELDKREAQKPTTPSNPGSTTPTTEAPDSLKYTVVLIKKGQKLMASGESTESTEVILRAGQVTCISPYTDQGIADMTEAKEIYNGEPLVKNHYCLIPRGGDGRGICAVDGDAYILVRGEYNIVQE